MVVFVPVMLVPVLFWLFGPFSGTVTAGRIIFGVVLLGVLGVNWAVSLRKVRAGLTVDDIGISYDGPGPWRLSYEQLEQLSLTTNSSGVTYLRLTVAPEVAGTVAVLEGRRRLGRVGLDRDPGAITVAIRPDDVPSLSDALAGRLTAR